MRTSSSSSFLFPFTLVIITLFCINGSNCARNRYPELEKLLTQLWIKDKNRLNIPQHIVLNLQGPIQGSREIPDRAPKPLFTFVDEARLNSTPTYRSFIALKDCFLPSLLDEDGYNPEKERLQEAFLESVIRTDVMMEAKLFLVERQLAPSDQNSFKSFLRTLWFSPYKRGKRENSCGFEHVFLGERRGKKVFGLHYWLTFYLREKSGEINYLGHSKQSRNPISALYTVAFRWNEIFLKDFDRFLVDRWTRAVDGSNAVHAVYVDFKKAFDSVPHQRLLYKLNRTGLRGNLLRWIQSFLIGRSQIVHVGDRQSAEVAVESGVPQGSVLGPTLFIIYVNDCVSELNCDVAMFADDVKLWSVIRTEFDEERLQADLTRLEKWSQDWLLPFNVTKCNVMRVGRTRSLNRRVYHLNGVPLQEVDAQKDLGVWVTASLKPSLHCSKVAKSAMSVLYLVKRAFSTFDEDCFVKVFRTFVRPQLEFAIQAWKPWTSKDLSILEKVQRRATKLVGGQGSLPYETRLSNLGLFPLSYRQLRGDLIQTFRLLRGQDCCLVPTDFFELATTTNLRGHPLKLRVTGAKLDTRKFFFSNRVIEDTRKFFFSNRVIEAWNALPAGVVMSTSVEAFKRNLDQIATNRHNAT
nr:unnamed protein product [Spirometra erinaceieuropaei]